MVNCEDRQSGLCGEGGLLRIAICGLQFVICGLHFRICSLIKMQFDILQFRVCIWPGKAHRKT